MRYSYYHNKNTNEDPKTSSVFETLLMLPDDVIWQILRSACFYNEDLPEFAGKLEQFEFWPHWNHSGTTNMNFVEPDLFIQFQAFDLIIEAKYSDNSGQYYQQWKKEIISYHNEYKNNKMYFMALGGNPSMAIEKVKHKDYEVPIYKCSWLSILIQINRLREDLFSERIKSLYNSQLQRQLSLIEFAFNINGVYNTKWFSDLENTRLLISSSSISTLKTFFNE